MLSLTPSTRAVLAVFLAASLGSLATAQQIFLITPPPGSQTTLPSAQVDGIVVETAGLPQTVFEVYFRTRYADGTTQPDIDFNGAFSQGILGWKYDVVNYDIATGIGEFSGRAKWLDQGDNWLDTYLPTDTLGSPNYTQKLTFQSQTINPQDFVTSVHPTQRTIDVVDVQGNAGRIEFLLDLLNTTTSQTITVDVSAQLTLPDQSKLDLPLGGPGIPVKQYTVAPGDFSFTSPVDPVGMLFSFPLDQPPFPLPIQEGEYHMRVSVFDVNTGAEYYDNEYNNKDFWVVDNAGKDFRDVTRLSGLDAVRLQGGSSPAAGNSILVFDYNQDGLTDLFFTNPAGASTFLALGSDITYPGGSNFLMRNNGDGSFSDVSAAAGVEGDMLKAAYGAAWGDLDDDGDDDMFVSNRDAAPYVYRNNGDGTFADVAAGSFGGLTNGWFINPRLGDIDADGDLDLYIGMYLKQWDTTWQSIGWADRIFRNELVEGILDPLSPGFPMFTFVTNSVDGLALAGYFADFNRDGNLDLAVHNDFGHFVKGNHLFAGDGNFGFTDVTVASGYDVKEFSMGAAVGDFDGDQNLDVYSSNIGRNSLLLGNGDGTFVQAIAGSGAEGIFLAEGPQANGVNMDDNWGAFVFDYDKDADTDLYVCGSDLLTGFNLEIAEIHPDSFYVNDGTAHFTNQALALGLATAGRGRSGAVLDYDLDGDLDVIVSNENEGVTLSRNDHVTSNHHVGVRPVATRSAAGAFNTFIEATGATSGTQVHETMTGCAHGTQQDNNYWFGLAGDTSAELTLHWPRGGSTTVFSAAADQEHQVHEMVVEIEGEIDGTASVGTKPFIKLLGKPGQFVVAAPAATPGSFALPGGGSLDINPLIAFALFTTLDANGEAIWPTPTLGGGLLGQTFLFQMTSYDVGLGIVPAKSGVSTLLVTP